MLDFLFIIFKKKLFLSFLYKDNEVVKEVKEDFNNNKSVYFELNKHVPKDAAILHIADDFGQKDFLLTVQQPGRKIFTLIKNEEKREIAAQNYLVKNRKINYIKDISQINKNINVLIISDPEFDLHEVKNLPEVIIFVNIKNTIFTNDNYKPVFSSDSLKIFKIK